MTSIAGNSANKQLADFGGSKKTRIGTAVKKQNGGEDIDDGKSDLSYMSSSNFSSVLKRGPINGGGLNDMSAISSRF
jgi:hypothetical protein